MDNKKLIIIIAIIVLFQMTFTFIFMFMLLNKSNQPPEKNGKETETELVEEVEQDEDLTKDYLKDFAVFALEDIVVNPKNSDGRFLLISMGFEYKIKDKKLPDELTSKLPLINDEMNLLLSSQDIADLENVEYREILKGLIMEKINSFTTEGKITRVLFSQFVIQ